MAEWTCESCTLENDATSDICAACGEARPEATTDCSDTYRNIKVGQILSMEPLKDKLRVLTIDVGSGTELKIVTNAVNVTEGSRVVVACVGAVIDGEQVKKATVGGVASHGMLCSPPMLGWTGGGADGAALVPDSFAVGSRPPESRPRMK